jgi:hypothetical protein
MWNPKMDSGVWQRRVRRRALRFSKAVISTLLVFVMAPSFAEPPNCAACDPTAQATALRHRLEFIRNEKAGVSLSFTGLNQEFLVHHSEIQLRLHDCTYDVAGDISGVVDILLAAKIAVGYPPNWENVIPKRDSVFTSVLNRQTELTSGFRTPRYLPLMTRQCSARVTIVPRSRLTRSQRRRRYAPRFGSGPTFTAIPG